MEYYLATKGKTSADKWVLSADLPHVISVHLGKFSSLFGPLGMAVVIIAVS